MATSHSPRPNEGFEFRRQCTGVLDMYRTRDSRNLACDVTIPLFLDFYILEVKIAVRYQHEITYSYTARATVI